MEHKKIDNFATSIIELTFVLMIYFKFERMEYLINIFKPNVCNLIK